MGGDEGQWVEKAGPDTDDEGDEKGSEGPLGTDVGDVGVLNVTGILKHLHAGEDKGGK